MFCDMPSLLNQVFLSSGADAIHKSSQYALRRAMIDDRYVYTQCRRLKFSSFFNTVGILGQYINDLQISKQPNM